MLIKGADSTGRASAARAACAGRHGGYAADGRVVKSRNRLNLAGKQPRRAPVRSWSARFFVLEDRHDPARPARPPRPAARPPWRAPHRRPGRRRAGPVRRRRRTGRRDRCRRRRVRAAEGRIRRPARPGRGGAGPRGAGGLRQLLPGRCGQPVRRARRARAVDRHPEGRGAARFRRLRDARLRPCAGRRHRGDGAPAGNGQHHDPEPVAAALHQAADRCDRPGPRLPVRPLLLP